ncbi:MAG: response regulator [Lachnospiraceae bacterium]|nr:response regulator [Lachnospiraceae bacterium]
MYTVAVIDDNRIAVQAIVESTDWELLGCQVIGTAFNGIDGLKLLTNEKPDIVITDIRMPGYNGLEMIQEMLSRNAGETSRFIVISGYNEFEYARQAIRLGVSDFLSKPVMVQELESALKKVIASIPRVGKADVPFGEQEMQLAAVREKLPEYSYMVQSAIRYIDNHMGDNISLSQMGQELSVSGSHLSKCFKRETGIGFSSYATLAKMCKARALLRNPKHRVYEVANMLGYHDYAYFFQVFKKIYGYSPSDEKQSRKTEKELGGRE